MRFIVLSLALAVSLNVFAITKNGFDLTGALIPVDEILSGGPPRDGIPAINEPKFESADEADWLRDKDRVLALVIQGQARAYPIRILNWHEIVNDKVGDQRFAVTYCPLCGTGVVFAANIANTSLQFGVSGLLYNSDVLLYDRNTESLWSQIMGKAVAGKLKGTLLPQIPVTHTSWKDWVKNHPDTLVLSRDTGSRRNYRNSPYAGYEKTRRLYFKVSHKSPANYHPKERVIGVEINGHFKAYPYKELSKNGKAEFTDSFAGSNLKISWNEEAQSGNITNTDGKALPVISSYWFAWFTFHPETEIYTAP
ncbi:MAG: DUF3179 domain-containing protein [Proteobacteria bacterium]|nr:DUF3179 domain-containing protein [Pseudomonadota bacterium]